MMISLLLIVGPCDQSFGFEDRVAGPSPAMTAVSVRPLPEVLHAGGRRRGSAGEHLNGAFEKLGLPLHNLIGVGVDLLRIRCDSVLWRLSREKVVVFRRCNPCKPHQKAP